MPTRSRFVRNDQRASITYLAARLIAEEGVQDYGQAKRKAARQLGVEDNRNLPGNDEIEAAVRQHQALYQAEEQPEDLAFLRQKALHAMTLLAPFQPRLAGSVLRGTAGRHANINLHLFADSDKEVEIFLLNRKLPFRHGEKRFRFSDGRRSVPCLTLLDPDVDIELALFQPADLRQPPRSPVNGQPLERAGIDQVRALVEEGPSRLDGGESL
jgi:hypothetical protein